MAIKSNNYHHGNLRQALIDAALTLLEQGGLEKLSLRAIARQAGVSQTAPYSHFKNRDELLAAVAAEGFRRFQDSMETEAVNTSSSGDRVAAFGTGYIEFGLANPALYRLMFRGDKSLLQSIETLSDASGSSFSLIENGVAEMLGHADRDAAIAAWSLVHGVVELALSGRVELSHSRAARQAEIARILAFLF